MAAIIGVMADSAAAFAHHPLTRAVARALRRRCGVGEGNHLLLAVSGGADSVALMRALAALRRGDAGNCV